MGRHPELLAAVGARVHDLRREQGLSRRRLAESSGLSERFLSNLESGRGNISLARFADVAHALGIQPALLLATATDARPIIALLGVRGAGKSTVGPRLADSLTIPFVEIDERIEAAAGLSLAEIFALHGETYYHRLQYQVLRGLIDTKEEQVIAVGGSIVNDDDGWNLLRQRCRTIWLRASAQHHWDRVVAQGDSRPMAQNPRAFAELEALMTKREPIYLRSNIVVDTTELEINDVAEAIRRRLADASY